MIFENRMKIMYGNFMNFFIYLESLFQKQELERSENNFQTQLTEQISKSEIQINELRQTLNQQEEILNTTKSNLDNLQKEKDEQEKLLGNNQQTIDDLQLKVSQLSTDLNQKVIK